MCVEECASHADCESLGKRGHWCCSNGCGHVCVTPLRAEAATSKAFIIIAALQRDADIAEIANVVPPPASKSELRSLRMLTLKYSHDSERDACQAFRQLSSIAKVSSVEWDGAPANCAETDL
ncbi:unnamed protein product [Symbiodinium pilosum]|uniref:WAP domain-containing protein n=1 Tax=Symbiodinium pilosum TaxID=2952 RepID=A0A812M624_SYMPI|nr:unnamed protein product [Symbiodinium pilosum]